MSASPASAVQYQVDTDTAPLDDTNIPASAEPATQPTMPEERGSGPGMFGSIRAGFADLFSRYRSTMTEVETQYRDAWNGGKPCASNPAGVTIPHSTPARILSEDGELLVEATMREEANGSALLRLHEPRSLPPKAIVQTSEDLPGRPVVVKWTSGSSAIIEFG